MKIFIIRHGNASPVSENYNEENRPLTEKGELEAKKLGQYYLKLGIKFDVIWSSPFVRAIQTKDNIFCSINYINYKVVDELKPWENSDYILRLIRSEYKETKILGIVGHQPQIGKILSKMFNISKDFIDIQPSTSIEIEMFKSAENSFQYRLISLLAINHIL